MKKGNLMDNLFCKIMQMRLQIRNVINNDELHVLNYSENLFLLHDIKFEYDIMISG